MTTILRTVLSSVAALLAGCTVSSPDWRGIVCHRAEGAIERIRTGRPDAADPRLQAVSVDQAGDVAGHREWMWRNYALTWGAVMLRLQMALLIGCGFTAAEAYPLVAWFAWVPNLAVAEWLVRRHRTQ